MRQCSLHKLLVGAIALFSVTAIAGPIIRAGRIPAPMSMQAASVPGRMTALTQAGVRTTHVIPTQSRLIGEVITRAGLKDPLVMHQSVLPAVRAGADGKLLSTAGGEFVQVAEKGYQLIMPVSGKSWQQSIQSIVPEIGALLQNKTMVPSNAQVITGQWFIEIGGKSMPVRPPMIRRTSHLGAM